MEYMSIIPVLIHSADGYGNSFLASHYLKHWRYDHEQGRQGLCSQRLQCSALMEAITHNMSFHGGICATMKRTQDVILKR